MSDLQRIKDTHELQMEQLRNGKMIMYSAHPKDVQWLIERTAKLEEVIDIFKNGGEFWLDTMEGELIDE